MQHSITLLGQIALTQLGGVLGYCPVEKQMTVPLSAYQMRGISLQNAVVAMLVKCDEFKINRDSVTSKAPSHLLLQIIRSPTLCLTKTQRLESKISNLDSSDQRTDFHRSNVHYSCFLAQASLFFLLVSFSSGFFATIQP